MTRDETKMILMRIQTTYPNWKPQGDLSLTIDVWHEYLSEYSYQEILGAVKAFVLSDTSGFAPTVGQVVGKLHGMIKSLEPEMNGLEAWALVSKAIRNGYYGAEEEYAKLPMMVQKAVGSPQNLRNWSQTDLKSIDTVVMSQFLSTYKAECIRENEMSRIPSELRIEVQENRREMLSEKNYLPYGD